MATSDSEFERAAAFANAITHATTVVGAFPVMKKGEKGEFERRLESHEISARDVKTDGNLVRLLALWVERFEVFRAAQIGSDDDNNEVVIDMRRIAARLDDLDALENTDYDLDPRLD